LQTFSIGSVFVVYTRVYTSVSDSNTFLATVGKNGYCEGLKWCFAISSGHKQSIYGFLENQPERVNFRAAD
jgi:hypothetical protein